MWMPLPMTLSDQQQDQAPLMQLWQFKFMNVYPWSPQVSQA